MPSDEPIACWVIVRKHSDNSGFEILRVHLSEKRAEQDLALVGGDFGMEYKSYAVPLFLSGIVTVPVVS